MMALKEAGELSPAASAAPCTVRVARVLKRFICRDNPILAQPSFYASVRMTSTPPTTDGLPRRDLKSIKHARPSAIGTLALKTK